MLASHHFVCVDERAFFVRIGAGQLVWARVHVMGTTSTRGAGAKRLLLRVVTLTLTAVGFNALSESQPSHSFIPRTAHHVMHCAHTTHATYSIRCGHYVSKVQPPITPVRTRPWRACNRSDVHNRSGTIPRARGRADASDPLTVRGLGDVEAACPHVCVLRGRFRMLSRQQGVVSLNHTGLMAFSAMCIQRHFHC